MPISLVVSVFVALLALGGGAYYLTTKTEVTVQLPPQPAAVAPQPVVVAPQVTVQVVPQAASPTKKVIPSSGLAAERVKMKFPVEKANP